MGMYAEIDGVTFKFQGLIESVCGLKAIISQDGFVEIPADQVRVVTFLMYRSIASHGYMEKITNNNMDSICMSNIAVLYSDVHLLMCLLSVIERADITRADMQPILFH